MTHPDQDLTRRLIALFLFGALGSVTELALLGHTEESLQWTPFVTLGCSIVAFVAWALTRASFWAEAARVTAWALVAAGGLGIVLHLRGNAEFEREMYPAIQGFELLREALTGATPALAPGSLVALGLLGILLLPPRSDPDDQDA